MCRFVSVNLHAYIHTHTYMYLHKNNKKQRKINQTKATTSLFSIVHKDGHPILNIRIHHVLKINSSCEKE